MFKRIYVYYLFLRGKSERKKGNYSADTLNLFSQVNNVTSNINTKFSYIWVLRHFGNQIDEQYFAFICTNFEKLSDKNKTLALNFILEFNPSYDIFNLANEAQIKGWAIYSPIISSFLKDHGSLELSEDEKKLGTFHRKQEQWKKEFIEYIAKNSQQICIVGNSSSMLTSTNGGVIDDHAVVIRFNDYLIGESSGNALDVWVKSPSFHPENSSKKIDVTWTILSGPDIRYTMLNWNETKVGLDSKVLTTPLHIWKELVLILEAPPSAGILTLAWILDIVKEPNLVSIAGFQLFTDSNTPYHHSSPNYKMGSRHNWEGERKKIREWCAKGVTNIDADFK